MITSAEVRQQFMDFFRSKGHEIVPSAPIVVKNDPTLMFTNAGMNQFKDYFLGNKIATHKRVADTQKCLRVSGKHNDLEEVGVDTYHHTMFEMLGNWSFGDYFKKEAIAWSWELLTKVYKIPADQLYVTIFEGDEKENIPKDEESYNEWKKWISEDRILPFGKKDNFWEMGDTGPCGPCTEIHVDCRSDEERKKVNGKTLVNKDHPQVIEIWNNVFIQFNRLKDGSLEPLPAKHVDTGMGLERLVRVLQDKKSNYDTDIFSGTIAEVEKITQKKYTASDSKEDVAFRVIADHIRAISFTIADGQLPSNTGAGYVIRRILRRAVRYYYSYLGYKEPLLNKLVLGIALQFKYVFPELYDQAEFVAKVVKEEEEGFLRTITAGINLFNSFIQIAESNFKDKRENDVGGTAVFKIANGNVYNLILNERTIPGDFAFELNDTYGFPVDLTQLLAREIEWNVDIKGFNEEMMKQKDRSRAASLIEKDDWISFSNQKGIIITAYNFEIPNNQLSGKVKQYRKIRIKGQEYYQIVLSITNFYPEGGGQVGDTGTLTFDGTYSIEVLNTLKENDLIVHIIKQLPPNLTKDTSVTPYINTERRNKIRIHHTATHLLHAALRKILGTHVAQKGSLVNDEHLRFDFSHFAKVTDEEISKVEALVNEKIRENIPVIIKEMPKDEALKMGAMALFGEKYGETVRVVIIDPNYSVELCGGTHVDATGELGFFKITSESAVAAGVRRIEAVAGKQAENYINEQFSVIGNIRESLKNPKDIVKAIENLQAENASFKKHIEVLEARQLVVIRNELLQKDESINGVNFIGEIVEVNNADALKKLCFDLKNHLRDHVIVLCVNIDGKPFVAVGISETVVASKNLDANKIIKEYIAPLIKGGGGGQKTLATAGGQDIGGLKEVIDAVRNLL